ncbi:hypothetical protein EDB83DRAFT_1272169 [Lactarius deliciosus]|nr:hypothetical protein EDB83DRAFT_1272169 [Lactarius deliciosus]
MPFRPNMTEGWRPSNGAWADDDSAEFPLGRPRQVSVAQGVTFSSPRTDDQPLGGSKPGFSPQRFDVNLNKESATTPRYSSPQPTTFSASPFSSQQVAQSHPMAYDPSHSPSVVDNLALGIRGMVVEDDASLSQQTPTYRNGNHVPAVVPGALPHIRAAPLQPRGPYTAFPPPEYASYYPGTPTGQCHRQFAVSFSDNFCQTRPCTHPPPSPQVQYRQTCIHRMACSTTMRGHLDPQVPNSIIPLNQHYTTPAIHHYSHLTLPSTYPQ